MTSKKAVQIVDMFIENKTNAEQKKRKNKS